LNPSHSGIVGHFIGDIPIRQDQAQDVLGGGFAGEHIEAAQGS